MNNLQRLAPDTLRIERVLDAPVETVWRWLVEPRLRAQWFAGGSSAAEPGPLQLVFDHDNLSADKVPYPAEYAQHKCATASERVLRAEPPRLLSFTWDDGAEGTVTFELEPLDGRTRLVLTHTGISGPAPMTDFGGGWLSHLEVLQTRLAGGVVRNFWEVNRKAHGAAAAALSSD